MDENSDFDVVVIGSGFGGSVTALRLVEKGYKVAVLEAGRRYADADFAKTSWHLREFLWAPALGCYGIQRIHPLSNCVVLAGAGVGGGSLNYANTLYVPRDGFFGNPQWAHIADWKSELLPYYDQARKMLGVVTHPYWTPADEVVKSVADEMGVGDTFIQTPVGVYFGEPGKTVPDPFFGGVGPDRTGCIECGECTTGCRHGAKNTLLKNYLGLAERGGAQIFPLTTVTAVTPQRDGNWTVATKRTGKLPGAGARTFTARHVVLAAGTRGTQKLLFKMRDRKILPRLSRRLGELTRTNSEAILGSCKPEVDPGYDGTRGVAITCSFYPSPDTHIEPVRYGKGSNAMGLLQTLMVDGEDPADKSSRLTRLAKLAARHPGRFLRELNVRNWSERTMLLLVMQNLDNSITTYTRRGLFGRRYVSRQGEGDPSPTWIPVGYEAAKRIAKKMKAEPGASWADIFKTPMTAHFLGGCVIGEDASAGVIDPYHRVHGYPSLYVVDGAAVSANPGVNPSLTISAQAERAASFWPNKGETDTRPAQGNPYRRIEAVAPHAPIVPAGAPAALVLPIVGVTGGSRPADAE
ncbi:FAD-dependent oxidoreductase [Nocardia tengchongensis]